MNSIYARVTRTHQLLSASARRVRIREMRFMSCSVAVKRDLGQEDHQFFRRRELIHLFSMAQGFLRTKM